MSHVQRRTAALEERNSLTLLELANVTSPINPWSDLPALPAVDKELQYDGKCYEENSGAADSEDEGESDALGAGDDRAEDEEETNDAMMLDMVFRNQTDHADAQVLPVDFTEVQMNDDKAKERVRFCHGALIGWKPPGPPPAGWLPAALPQGARQAPKDYFSTVDNPGNWLEHTYLPKYESRKKGPIPLPFFANGCDASTNGSWHWQMHFGRI